MQSPPPPELSAVHSTVLIGSKWGALRGGDKGRKPLKIEHQGC